LKECIATGMVQLFISLGISLNLFFLHCLKRKVYQYYKLLATSILYFGPDYDLLAFTILVSIVRKYVFLDSITSLNKCFNQPINKKQTSLSDYLWDDISQTIGSKFAHSQI